MAERGLELPIDRAFLTALMALGLQREPLANRGFGKKPLAPSLLTVRDKCICLSKPFEYELVAERGLELLTERALEGLSVRKPFERELVAERGLGITTERAFEYAEWLEIMTECGFEFELMAERGLDVPTERGLGGLPLPKWRSYSSPDGWSDLAGKCPFATASPSSEYDADETASASTCRPFQSSSEASTIFVESRSRVSRSA